MFATCAVGPGEFVSRDRIRLNEWTTVIAERNRNDGSLIVDEQTAVKGRLFYGIISCQTDCFFLICVTNTCLNNDFFLTLRLECDGWLSHCRRLCLMRKS